MDHYQIYDPNNNTLNQLAEERTVLAFIRTVSIFCGLYVLLKSNIKHIAFYKIIIVIVNAVLLYRLFHLENSAHKISVRILGVSVIAFFVGLLVLT